MIKAQHKSQRVGVFVDVQNMYYSAKQLYNNKVNFKTLLEDAVANRKLVRAIAYVIKADVKDENMFHEALEEIGFEVKAKDLQVFYGGAKKGDWDVGIAMDVMRLAPKLDTIVLISGDGDFSDLLEHAKSLGCRAEVMAFGKTTSHKLLEVADQFIDLDNQNRYLLERKTSRTRRR
ncbi:MAG: NYN domain-containing protein [Candidatus Thermoplasmatota archaeon]